MLIKVVGICNGSKGVEDVSVDAIDDYDAAAGASISDVSRCWKIVTTKKEKKN